MAGIERKDGRGNRREKGRKDSETKQGRGTARAGKGTGIWTEIEGKNNRGRGKETERMTGNMAGKERSGKRQDGNEKTGMVNRTERE